MPSARSFSEFPAEVRADALLLIQVAEQRPRRDHHWRDVFINPGLGLPEAVWRNRDGDIVDGPIGRNTGMPEVAGFGLFLLDGVARTAIVSYRPELRAGQHTIDAWEPLRQAVEPIRHQLSVDPVVLGLPPPLSASGCGSELWAGEDGSSGPMVARGASKGLLTAGHVATNVGTIAYLDGAQWGMVAFTTHGTSNPADVAFVQSSERSGTHPRCPQPTQTIRPELGASVSGFGARTCRTANVLGIMPFQWFPALGRNLAEIMVTAQVISVPGDSGGLVTDDASGLMVGHIVGNDSDAHTYTSVQLADFALPAAGCAL